MTENSMEIGKLLVPDQVTASHLKQALIQSADSASTRRNRKHFWKKFKEWCEARGNSPLPSEPDTVILYLLDQARQGKKKSTLSNMRWAIDTTHQQHGFAAFRRSNDNPACAFTHGYEKIDDARAAVEGVIL